MKERMMSIKDHPVRRNTIRTQRVENASTDTDATVVGKVFAVVRIATGLLFGWAFVDKLFGLGYATASTNAWVNGGSPTKGFLGHIDHGPLASMFRSWAGAWWADWLFMLGLGGIAVALLFGVGLRVAAVSGTVMMLLMWAAEWPLDRFTDTGEPTMSTNPILDYHILYALIMIQLAVVAAGNTWGLGRRWAQLDIVRKNGWLR
jgi:thiosulfate dehydrogenase [quinone] large subunit